MRKLGVSIDIEPPSSNPRWGLLTFCAVSGLTLSAKGDMTSMNFSRTDVGNAEMFVHLYGKYVRYDHDNKCWLLWAKHWWEEDSHKKIYELAIKSVRMRQEHSGQISSSAEMHEEIKHCSASLSANRLEAMLKLVSTMPGIATRTGDWNNSGYLLGVANGVVDLKTGVFSDGEPEQLITYHCHAKYDTEAAGERWHSFLHEVFAGDTELVRFIQKAVGYSLTGDTSEQCFFLLHGNGGNGKSTLLDAIKQALGDYSATTPFSTFEQNSKSQIPNDVADLVGSRMVTSSESNELDRFNEARIKCMTGGEAMKARRLYGDLFEFRPTFKVWFSVNFLPRIHDPSEGMWRRVRPIPFKVDFRNTPDRHLNDKLLEEKDAILKWAIDGCLLWQQEGLQPTAAMLVELADYRESNDTILEFINECCELRSDATAEMSSIWKTYQNWANEAGIDRPLSRGQLSQQLLNKGCVKSRTGKACTRIWRGIELVGLSKESELERKKRQLKLIN